MTYVIDNTEIPNPQTIKWNSGPFDFSDDIALRKWRAFYALYQPQNLKPRFGLEFINVFFSNFGESDLKLFQGLSLPFG